MGRRSEVDEESILSDRLRQTRRGVIGSACAQAPAVKVSVGATGRHRAAPGQAHAHSCCSRGRNGCRKPVVVEMGLLACCPSTLPPSSRIMSSTQLPKSAPERQVIEVRPAGEDHRVVSVSGPEGPYRRRPCSDCPWRVDAAGEFPAEAFRLSARTAADMSDHVFSCHQSGSQKPAVCAGFLLRGADHNLAVRLGYMRGGSRPTFAMAASNCMPTTEPWRLRTAWTPTILPSHTAGTDVREGGAPAHGAAVRP